MNVRMVWLIITVLLFGCGWPFGQETNPNIEIIIPKDEDIRGWILSPGGDKIIYDSIPNESVIDVLFFLETQQKDTIDNCSTSVIWLDNTKLLCLNDNGGSASVLTADDLTRVHLQEIKDSAVNLEKLLQNAGTIYRYEGEYNFSAEDNAIFILSPDYKSNKDENFRLIVENVDEALAGYDYMVIPQQKTSILSGREQSSDGKYYYILKNSVLKIYDAATDEMLVEYNFFDQGQIVMGGWARDNSGVYFQPMRGGGLAHTEPGAIMKLKVSQ